MAAVVRMPAVLAGATEAALAHWLVSPGETVSVGTPIAEIETEKAMVEYEAEESGIVGRLLLGEGDTGEIGDPIAVLVAPGEGDAEIDAALGGSAAAAAAAAPGRVAEAAEDTAAEAGQAVADAAASSARNAAAPAASAGSGGAVRGTNGHSGAAHGGRVFASPLVRKLASERGVDLAELSGTGPNGRIVRRDLERFLAAGPALSARPLSGQSVPGQSVPGQPGSGQPGSGQPGSGQPGTGPAERAGGGGAGGTALLGAPGGATGRGAAEPAVVRDNAAASPRPAAAPAAATAGAAGAVLVPHTPMRRAIARRLTESKATIPHFYLTAEPVADELLALRARVNETSPVKVSVNDFVIAAAAAAFGDVPEANVTWTDEGLLRYRSVDISIAVATDAGLVTPVLRGAEGKKLSAIARESAELAQRARDRRLLQHELEGGTFAISNLGMYGTAEFSAIINPPQSGILAVGAARPQPVVADGAVVPATVMRCTLSVDHRAIDGALAARWLAAFTARIEHPLGTLV